MSQNNLGNGIGTTTNPSSKELLQPAGDIISLFVDNVKDYAIFMIDVNGFITSWNAGARNIKGYFAKEILGKHISVFYTPEDVELGVPLKNLEETARHGRFETEGWRVRKNGSLFWANVVFTALYNAEGSLIGFAKVTRDISERKKAEEKIAHIANLLEKASDAIYSIDASNCILTWNKAAEILYGYTRDEVLQKAAAEILKPEIPIRHGTEIKKELAEKGFWKGELVHTRKDGARLWIFASITILKNEKGEEEESVCICRDITELKKAGEEVKRVNEELKQLNNEKLHYSLKEVSDYKYALDKACIVAITNQKGIITYVNENFCSISKYSEAELIGQDHRIINSGYHSKEFIRRLWVTIGNGITWKGEIKNRAKDGTYYWVDTTIVPFLNEHGKPYQYVAIRADITERKNAVEELKKLNEQLEEHVNNRTQLLELANKELESFSYSVSHDLRAPLRAIGGYSRILQEDYEQVLDAEGNRLLNNIITNSKRMGRLIDDLLSFSRMSRKEITQTDINMYLLVNECLEELFFDKSSHNYTVDIGDLHACFGDSTMLKQVWQNLLDNAIKYSSKNAKPHVVIGSNDDGLSTIYYVKDNGVGFDMKYVHKLFGVFQRLHSNEEFEGTGVGLALVKRIINKHDGNVWAESEPGIGSTFYFSIPKNITA